MIFKKSPSYKDDELVRLLRQEPDSPGFREAAAFLYDTLETKGTRWLLKKNRLDAASASEICRQALFLLLENLSSGKYEGRGKISAYFWKILENTKNGWFRQQQRNTELTEFILSDLSPEEQLIQKEEVTQVGKLLDQLNNPKCKKLLLWDTTESNLKSLTVELGYSSENTLYVTRTRCLKAFIELLEKEGYI